MEKNIFLTNESNIIFLDKIKSSLAKCKSFRFTVSFIKKAGLILLSKDIEAALERGAEGYLITSTLPILLLWKCSFPGKKNIQTSNVN